MLKTKIFFTETSFYSIHKKSEKNWLLLKGWLGYFHIDDMQIVELLKKNIKKSRFYFFVEILAECSETNEKPIFRFLVCEKRYTLNKVLCDFELWSIMYLTLHSELGRIQKKIMLGRFRHTHPHRQAHSLTHSCPPFQHLLSERLRLSA